MVDKLGSVLLFAALENFQLDGDASNNWNATINDRIL